MLAPAVLMHGLCGAAVLPPRRRIIVVQCRVASAQCAKLIAPWVLVCAK